MNEKILVDVFKTNKYSMFKAHPKNREISKRMVKYLVESISSLNLLHIRPILVNEAFEVIDGQHRLKAAEFLKTEIYYQVIKESDDAIRKLNTVTKGWKTKDYIPFYSTDPNYIKLMAFAEKYQLSVAHALFFFDVDTASRSNTGQEFRSGNFKYPEDDSKANAFASFARTFWDELFSMNIPKVARYKNRSFIRAMVKFLKCPLIKSETFFKKLPMCLHLLIPLATTEGALKVLLSVYNYKSQTHVTYDEVVEGK